MVDQPDMARNPTSSCTPQLLHEQYNMLKSDNSLSPSLYDSNSTCSSVVVNLGDNAFLNRDYDLDVCMLDESEHSLVNCSTEFDNYSDQSYSVVTKRTSCMYPYTHDLIQLELRGSTGQRTQVPQHAQNIVTPLIAEHWAIALEEHPDQAFVRYIVTGITKGFHIGFDHSSKRVYSSTQNMQSALRNPGPVVAYLEAELAANRIVGPFTTEEVPLVQVSRFGVLPKSGQPGEWRLILDLSSPRGFSVNDGVDPSLCSLQYTTVDEAVGYILSLGKGALLAKIDIKQAYCNILVHPEDRHLLGMSWQSKVYNRYHSPIWFTFCPQNLLLSLRCFGLDPSEAWSVLVYTLH